MKHIIELKKLSKKYRNGGADNFAVKEIDFILDKGESLAIVGPSGSGKSTLLNMIGGLDKPTTGEVIINGHKLNDLGDKELSKFRNKTIGFVFQFFNLQEYLTALENVMIPLLFSGTKAKDARNRSMELLKKVGLEARANYYPKQLSGGEMQRVAVARGLANNPSILLADEPTANLDKASAEKVLDLFEDIAKTGVSVVVITHDHSVSQRFANNLNLKNGEVEKA